MSDKSSSGAFTSALRFLARDCLHEHRVASDLTCVADLSGRRAADGADKTPLLVTGIAFERCTKCGQIRMAGAPDVSLAGLEAALSPIVARAIGSHFTLEVGQRAPEAVPTEVAPLSDASMPKPTRPADRTSIEDLATQFRTRVSQPSVRLEDVVLSAITHRSVMEALEKIRSYSLIYETWGFSAVDPKGRSITLNFFGPSGTGKSRTAEALAQALDRPVLRVAAADVEARYLGDSPRNVRAIFQAAREAGAVLFFDEADALFGRRASEVTQGVDHEVNAVKTTLLTELDAFDGVVILATNLQEVIDPAFIRRIAWHVHFRKPDLEARRKLWELHLVPGIPLAEPRGELIAHLADASEGRSGGDILTTLRIGLPAAVRRCAGHDRVLVSREDIVGAMSQVEEGYRHVGVRRAEPVTVPRVAPKPQIQTIASAEVPAAPIATVKEE